MQFSKPYVLNLQQKEDIYTSLTFEDLIIVAAWLLEISTPKSQLRHGVVVLFHLEKSSKDEQIPKDSSVFLLDSYSD